MGFPVGDSDQANMKRMVTEVRSGLIFTLSVRGMEAVLPIDIMSYGSADATTESTMGQATDWQADQHPYRAGRPKARHHTLPTGLNRNGRPEAMPWEG